MFRGLLVLFFFLSSGRSLSQEPVDRVYPFLDAANSRWFYFSSASIPFGMVSLFPDNNISGEWNSGYRYSEDTVRCLSHIHEWQLSGVAVLPVSFAPDEILAVMRNSSSPFSHDQETVSPGYHRLRLDRYGVDVELTASSRAGFHRYSFPQTAQRGVIFDLGGQLGPSYISSGGFVKTGNRQIRGYMVNAPTIRRPKETPVYFTAIFDKPIAKIYVLAGGRLTTADHWDGENGRILVTFEGDDTTLLMKVGVSFTAEEGAAANVNDEIPHWNFDQTKLQARDRWNEMLGRIRIEGGTEKQQVRFYTDLSHAIQGRRIVSDADGKYADCSGEQRIIRQVPLDENGRPMFNMYNSDAFWGTQWTLNTLWHLVYPEISEEFCQSLLEYYRNGALIPRGPSGGNDTFVMTGASSTPFFVSAWQKGIRGFDIALAYEGLKKNHSPGGAMSKAGYEHWSSKGGGIEHYMHRGYVPYPLDQREYGFHQDGAGMTMEYAYQDWALAQLAKAFGRAEDYSYFMTRSNNYKNLFNPRTGFIQPKDSLGNWKHPFDPLSYDNGFVEGNAAQFTWFVPHDLQGLANLMGGHETATLRLNKQFEQSLWHRFCNEHPGQEPRFVDDKRTWINYSNQPGMQAAFIFNYLGAPWLTQYWSREVVNHVYNSLSPYQGYGGDEDQGLMGSLSVLMKVGLFQMTGGCEANPAYDIGSPVFDVVTIKLDPRYYPGKSLRIEARNTSAVNRYIQSAFLNGKKFKSAKICHNDLVGGGTLVFNMGDSPNKRWGGFRKFSCR